MLALSCSTKDIERPWLHRWITLLRQCIYTVCTKPTRQTPSTYFGWTHPPRSMFKASLHTSHRARSAARAQRHARPPSPQARFAFPSQHPQNPTKHAKPPPNSARGNPIPQTRSTWARRRLHGYPPTHSLARSYPISSPPHTRGGEGGGDRKSAHICGISVHAIRHGTPPPLARFFF